MKSPNLTCYCRGLVNPGDMKLELDPTTGNVLV